MNICNILFVLSLIPSKKSGTNGLLVFGKECDSNDSMLLIGTSSYQGQFFN